MKKEHRLRPRNSGGQPGPGIGLVFSIIAVASASLYLLPAALHAQNPFWETSGEPYCDKDGPCDEECTTGPCGDIAGSLDESDNNEDGAVSCTDHDEDNADPEGSTFTGAPAGPANVTLDLGGSDGIGGEKPMRALNQLRHRGANLGAGTAARDKLHINEGHGCKVIRENYTAGTGDICQVVSDGMIVDVEHIDDNDPDAGYTMTIFDYATLPPISNGYYDTTDNASGLIELRTITIKRAVSNSDPPVTTLEVHQAEHGSSPASKPSRKLVYARSTTGSGTTLWTLTESVINGGNWRVYRTDELRRRVVGAGFAHLRRKQIADSNGTMATVSKVWELWALFNVNSTQRTRLLERHTYATDNPGDPLPPPPATAPAGALSKVVNTYFGHITVAESFGRVKTKKEYTFDESMPVETQSSTYSYDATTTYDYREETRTRASLTETLKTWTYDTPAGLNLRRYPVQPRTFQRILGGRTVEYVTRTVALATGEIVATETVRGGAGANEVTITYYHDETAAAIERFRPKAVSHPDGTWTIYQYSTPADYDRQVVVESGVGSKTSVTNGTRVTNSYNRRGYVVAQVTEDILSGEETAQFQVIEFEFEDPEHRPKKTRYDDNSNDYSEVTYNCCGVASRRERSGLTTTYHHDVYGRVNFEVVGYSDSLTYKTTRSAITGAAGGGMKTTRVQYSGDEMTNSPEEYLVGERSTDAAGRTTETRSPDADGDGNEEVATYGYEVLTGGKLQTTVTRAVDTGEDDAESITIRYGSGEVYERRGNAVADTRYGYGVISNENYRLTRTTTRITKNGTGVDVLSEWEIVTSDPAGRPVLRVISPGGTAYAESYTYLSSNGSKGKINQLERVTDMDGVARDFRYDGLGRRYRSAVPDDGVGISLQSDRISETLQDVYDDSGAGGVGISHRTRSYVYKPGSPTPVLVSTEYRAVTGDESRTDRFGQVSTWVRAEGTLGDGIWTETSTGAAGVQTVRSYTDWRLASVETRDSNGVEISKISYAYDGHAAALKLDGLGWVSSQTDSRNNSKTSFTYEETGAVATENVEGGTGTTDDIVTTYHRDRLGRVDKIDFPEGGSLQTTYSESGQVLKRWGAHTYPVTYEYDEQGRMTAMHTYRGIATTTEPLPGTHTSDDTEWSYDADTGRLDSKSDDAGEETGYAYTNAGRLYTRTWARTPGAAALTTTYYYDLASGETGDDTNVSTRFGDLTRVDYSDSTADITYTRDRLGRLVTVDDAFGDRTFTYNDTTDLTLDKEALDGVAGADLVVDIERTYTDGRYDGYDVSTTGMGTVNYTFDAAGRLDLVKEAGSTVADYSYLTKSYRLVAGVNLNPAGNKTLYVGNSYETYRPVLDTRNNEVDYSTISKYDYSVNDDGQRTDVAMSGSAFSATTGWGWKYNSSGELESAKHDTSTAYNRAYDYDGLGNREKSSEGVTDPETGPWTGGTQSTYSPDDLNQYTSITTGGTARSRSHDEDGNLLDDGTRTYTWDAENRLATVTDKAGANLLATYTYDYMGRRVRKETTTHAPQGATDTLYLYDGWNVVAEYDNSGSSPALARSRVWGLDISGSMQGAGGVGGLLKVRDHTDSNADYYPYYDGNGNVSEYIKASDGSVALHLEYDGFGKIVKSSSATEQAKAKFSYQFSTKPADEETGWNYYGYRYYDPGTGRWPSRDPIGERGGLNLYGFVGNDSVNYGDRLGLKKECSIGSEKAEKKHSLGPFHEDGTNPDELIEIAEDIINGVRGMGNFTGPGGAAQGAAGGAARGTGAVAGGVRSAAGGGARGRANGRRNDMTDSALDEVGRLTGDRGIGGMIHVKIRCCECVCRTGLFYSTSYEWECGEWQEFEFVPTRMGLETLGDFLRQGNHEQRRHQGGFQPKPIDDISTPEVWQAVEMAKDLAGCPDGDWTVED